MSGQRLLLKLLFGTCLALGLGACQAIAGIEERKADPDGADPDSPECTKYCSLVMGACTDEFKVYISEDVCLALCRHMDPGQSLELAPENTLACRTQQATFAELEPDVHCRNAGPGGNGECGSDCEAYCQFLALTCPSELMSYTPESCMRACSGLTDRNRFDIEADHDGDSIECRLVHVSSAAVDPVMHCPHSSVAPRGKWCVGDPKVSPTCEEYCNIQLAVCGVDGEFAQYETKAQCLGACAALAPGLHADRTEDTVGCRRYHAFNAASAGPSHCFHSGPSGDGHCGDAGDLATARMGTGNCDSYCQIVKEACPEQFSSTYTSAASCRADCLELDEAATDSEYAVVASPSGKGLHCRLQHAVRGFENAAFCDGAVGASPCE